MKYLFPIIFLFSSLNAEEFSCDEDIIFLYHDKLNDRFKIYRKGHYYNVIKIEHDPKCYICHEIYEDDIPK